MERLAAFLLPLLMAALYYISPVNAFAWGEYGHLTVCDLAYRNLTDPSKEELKRIFHAGQAGITVRSRDGVELRHYTSFNVGCLEQDVRPRPHPRDHFVNVDRSTKSISQATCPAGGACAFAGIERDLGVLKDRSKSDEDRVFALMAVGHWIGDIHQPLHISFADDVGGNSIKVRLTGGCGTSDYRPSVFHGVWDNCLLEAGMFERVRQRADYRSDWSERTITYRAVDSLLVNTTLTEEKSMVGTDPAAWANESFQITVEPDVLYCVKVGDSCQYTDTEPELVDGAPQKRVQITQAYLTQFSPVAQERVRQAGFRLAHLINLALDANYREPIQNSTQLP
ncbi:S1/P1 nuclease [Rhizobiaceae bacterium n13]|uniref:S1/P1 nuclease n=1 Tax=Ferirhizobium litorale TaxID=2927786 RepID=A0AAE3QE61_9HYPH|nr:S1/P1 nuclease [Fererhizobium litorale]MDI7863714.1 S1/P1 nuclease [Fererhizobium litorale]MDI7924187.1 S1/P1 nuclease [Fererhizobium litorale]